VLSCFSLCKRVGGNEPVKTLSLFDDMNADSLLLVENDLLATPILSYDEFLRVIAKWIDEAGLHVDFPIALLGDLGQGAFARVTLGHADGRPPVAIKRYTAAPHALGPAQLYGAALREGIILRRLRGAPNVLQLQGVCISVVPGSPVPEVLFVLDYVNGRPFSKVHFPRQATPVETVRRALLPLAYALESIHKVAVHLDLSPDNILVGIDASVTVIDLNGALPTRAWGHKTAVTGLVVGKHYYMAPEQV
jgi:serine/threonine protein kinase